MPQITIDDDLLGGLNPLLKLARSGDLEHLAQGQNDPGVQISLASGGYSNAWKKVGNVPISPSAIRMTLAVVMGEAAGGIGATRRAGRSRLPGR